MLGVVQPQRHSYWSGRRGGPDRSAGLLLMGRLRFEKRFIMGGRISSAAGFHRDACPAREIDARTPGESEGVYFTRLGGVTRHLPAAHGVVSTQRTVK
jgi:hypothetical protein